ncbi:rRNA processing protein, putative [Talaromyces stipitatus ATCC 10500]|uniref:rRNA processing protein, putative n=1 Tax=Talaromyces stipitatus (strain ATCC 10500 / CBS 375.48 / QM 6759 / NRRL 1006) TaxID=441959 RepID=B8MFR5_TALSN|nr:rRNA processing protein, putative [Talaromyces stipitatus ATCC 10500]EED17055.1 rRNA processing protein, putative [Talaromyces stipitatus ATCC 10500]
MRAKRSKKYRKLMHQYELTFGFHEPYQVLVDSNFLRAVHQFKMDLIPALERTLQGKAKPLLSKCSLAAIMAAQPINPKTNKPYRPYHLPPPTELPLRHCSHNDDDTPIDEVECLLSLICPNTDTMRNKEHYILATAEPVPLPQDDVNSDNPKQRRQAEALMKERSEKAVALRSGARAVPGVPIIYVKRSVMVLEPFSIPSEKVRLGVEKSKFKVGMEAALDVVNNLKRKREDEEDGPSTSARDRTAKKAKAPNPLSMKKPKRREKQKPEEQGKKKDKKPEPDSRDEGTQDNAADAEGEQSGKKKRKRKHKSSKSGNAVESADGAVSNEVHSAGDD